MEMVNKRHTKTKWIILLSENAVQLIYVQDDDLSEIVSIIILLYNEWLF